MLHTRSATFLFLALAAIVSANELSWYNGSFEWSEGYVFPLPALGLGDSFAEFELELNVNSTQRFVDNQIQRYKNKLVREGRDLNEDFLDSAHLNHLKLRPFGSRRAMASKLSNISLSGLSKPLINTITKMKHHNDGTPKIVSYLFEVIYPTLVINASYNYNFRSRARVPPNGIRCSGQLSVQITNTTVEGSIRVHEDENEKIQKVISIDIAPYIPIGFQMRMTKCKNASTDAMILLWNSRKYLAGKRLKDKFLPVVKAKILRNLNSLINSPRFPVN